MRNLEPVVWGVVVAAGASTRMGLGADNSKVLLTPAGKSRSILDYTIKSLLSADIFGGIIVVCRESDLVLVKEIVNRQQTKTAFGVVVGGSTRSDSVKNGIKALPPEVTHVAIHDGARPLVGAEDVNAVVAKGIETGAAILASPCRYSIKKVIDLQVEATVDRANLWEAQTPQVFERSLITEALKLPDSQYATDDAGLVERLEIKVSIVVGSYLNIKITTADDLKLVEGLLK